ncbi:MAG: family 20 glycosylhydrolase, partial [Victivallales bacterium]|nr:family 20 glycosylhydrolase [Victivallales bacterium]
PNLTIRDWPSVPLRGLISDCNWGNERMGRNDWYQAINAISSFKLNALCLGIYNCVPSCRVSEPQMPSEFLMTPISPEPNDSDPRSLSRFRFYNQKYDRWYDRTELPTMFEEDFFSDVLNYGKERGVAIYPYFNLLSSSSLLPTILPALSAKNAKGKPTNASLCLTSREAREALMDFLGKFLRKYYPKGVKYFHLGLAELNEIHAHERDGGCESPWCKCPKCKALSEDKRLAGFLEFMVKELVARGVEKVVIFSNLLDKLKGFRQALSALLKKPAVKGHLIVDFQDLGNETGKKYASTCNPKGIPESWLSPLGGQGNYANYHECLKQLDAGILASVKASYQGVMANFQFDPAYLDHLALLGVRTWEGNEVAKDSLDELRIRWAELVFGGMGKRYLKALDQLSHAASQPVLQLCLPFPYFTIQAVKAEEMLPSYPADALAALSKHANASKELSEVSAEAAEASSFFAKQLSSDQFSGEVERCISPMVESLHSLYASAQRVMVYADYFQTLLKVKGLLAAKKGTSAVLPLLDGALSRLSEQFKVIEAHMPDWLMWLNMQQMGCHKLFLEQFKEQLAKKTPVAKLFWSLPSNWVIPEDN